MLPTSDFVASYVASRISNMDIRDNSLAPTSEAQKGLFHHLPAEADHVSRLYDSCQQGNSFRGDCPHNTVKN